MPDLEVDGAVISLDGGQTYVFRQGRGAFQARDLATEETDYIARVASTPFTGRTLPALTAPSFLTKPTITASNTTIGVTLGGTNGTWAGNPAPDFHQTIWAKGGVAAGNIIAGANGGTLSTTGAEVGDTYYRGTVIKSVINGQEVFVTEWSLPFTLTAQQTLQIVNITTPIVAGQPASITFNDVPDAVTGSGGVTFAGTGTTRTFFGPSDPGPNLTIGATKAKFTPISRVYDVVPAPADIGQTANSLVQLTNVYSDTAAASVEVLTGPYAGTYTVNPADLQLAPVNLKLPAQTGTPAVGSTLTLDTGLWANLGSAGEPWEEVELLADNAVVAGVETPTYTVASGMAGKALRWRVTRGDSKGVRSALSNSVSIPAAASVTNYAFTTNRSNIKDMTLEDGKVVTRTTTAGQVEALDGKLITRSNAAYVFGALNQGGNQYVECDYTVGSVVQGAYPAVRVQADGSNATLRRGIAVIIDVGKIQVRHYTASGGFALVNDTDWTLPTDGSWAAGTTHRVGLEITSAGAVSLWVDGVLRRSGTFTDLSNGGAGVISNGTASTNGIKIDNITIRSAR